MPSLAKSYRQDCHERLSIRANSENLRICVQPTHLKHNSLSFCEERCRIVLLQTQTSRSRRRKGEKKTTSITSRERAMLQSPSNTGEQRRKQVPANSLDQVPKSLVETKRSKPLCHSSYAPNPANSSWRYGECMPMWDVQFTGKLLTITLRLFKYPKINNQT